MAETKKKGRFSRSWELAKLSWRVVNDDRGLLRFPIMSFVVGLVILVIAGAMIAALLVPYSGDEQQPAWTVACSVVVGVLFGTWVTYLFSGGLIAAANERLQSREGSYKDGMAAARSQSGTLFKWGLINLTVGVILSWIQDQAGFLGSIVSALGGLAWRVASWLAVPAIVLDGLGPIDAIKTSSKMLKTTWGENVIGNFGFGFITMLAILPFLLIVGLGFVISNGIVVFGGMFLLVLAVLVSNIFVTAMSGVFRAALYHYASTGETPGGFPADTLENAFVTKRSRLGAT